MLAKEQKARSKQEHDDLVAWQRRMLQRAAREQEKQSRVEHDTAGRTILRGPQPAGDYKNVHIISNTYGVSEDDGNVHMSESVIDAPYCIKPSSIHLASYYGSGMVFNCR
ncbi:hypothetical protein [Burkholderia sp. PU8-34]